MESHAMKSRS